MPQRSDKAILRATDEAVDASARAFREQLRRWMLRYARAEAHVMVQALEREGLRYMAKAAVADHETLIAELREFLAAFGLRRLGESARQTGNIVGGTGTTVVIPERFKREFLRGHEPRLQKILEETRQATRASVGDIVRAAMDEDTRPSIGQIAQRIRWQFHGDVGAGGQVVSSRPVVGRGILPTDEITTRTSDQTGEQGILYAFSTARAALIARTEMSIADSTGKQGAFEAMGVKEIKWIAVTSDQRSGGRRHWQMNGVIVPIGEYFELPDGTKLKHPHDAYGVGNVIGNIINCRCTSRAVRRRGG